MSVTDDEIDMPEDKATCPECFYEHAPCDCPEIYDQDILDEGDEDAA